MNPGERNKPGEVELRPGAEPLPDHILVERLGKGGFGEVWKAQAPGGFHVALKFVILSGAAGDLERRSLDIIRRVRHPNLLTPFGAWIVGGWLIIGMDVADQTLLDRFHEAQTEGLQGIPREELIEYLAEAAKGIDYLNSHSRGHETGGASGIQHRDIKPQNILLVGGGVRVADFGLVRLMEHSMTGHTGSLTLAYAAPEFFGKETSDRSDQYSLAATYCHLRGGRLLFSGTHEMVMAGHLFHPPDLSMLPEEERPAVARALNKIPKHRWPSCRAFVKALQESRTGSGHETRFDDLTRALPITARHGDGTRPLRVEPATFSERQALEDTETSAQYSPGETPDTGTRGPSAGPGLHEAKGSAASSDGDETDGPDERDSSPRADPSGNFRRGQRVKGLVAVALVATVAISASFSGLLDPLPPETIKPKPVVDPPKIARAWDEADAICEKADALFRSNDSAGAITAFGEAIRRAPNHARAYQSRGNAYRNRGEFERAIDDYDRAIRLRPTDASNYYHRGLARFLRGDNSEAITDFGMAIRLDPENETAYDSRGNAYSRKGDLERAKADHDRAAEIRSTPGSIRKKQG